MKHIHTRYNTCMYVWPCVLFCHCTKKSSLQLHSGTLVGNPPWFRSGNDTYKHTSRIHTPKFMYVATLVGDHRIGKRTPMWFWARNSPLLLMEPSDGNRNTDFIERIGEHLCILGYSGNGFDWFVCFYVHGLLNCLARCTSLTNCVVFVVLRFSSRIENGAKLNEGLSQITPFITVDGDY